ncbi:MAG: hypothetical protein JF617_14200 [Burkholderiales bacterium]|nr:hypothetical protein [Burkholderiales bacterium]
MKKSIWKLYGYGWVTLGFFLVSLVGHWVFGWFAYVDEQIGGLAFLLYVGSPQSKEGDDRMEAKIDAILAAVDPKNADVLIDEIDREYAGRHTDLRWTRMAKKDAS